MSRRGVSTVVSYVLVLGIASLLVTGLLAATGGYVANQRQGTVREGLTVLGHRLAADLAAADRLVRAGGTTVHIERRLPDRVAGVPYWVHVTPGTPVTTLTLSSPRIDVAVSVTVRTQTSVGPTGGTTLDGGRIVIEYTGTRLEVRDGD